ASPPSLVSADAGEPSRSSVERISNGPGSNIVAGADFPPVEEDLPSRRNSSAGRGAAHRAQANEWPARDAASARAARGREGSQGSGGATAAAAPQSAPVDLFANPGGATTGVSSEALSAGPSAGGGLGALPSQASGRDGAGSTLLVPNPKFKLQY